MMSASLGPSKWSRSTQGVNVMKNTDATMELASSPKRA